VTAVLEALDLDTWVQFSTGGDKPCEAGNGKCPLEAVAEAVFEVVDSTGCCECGPARCLVCVGHRDELLAADAARHAIRCQKCGALMKLLRMDPLR
jgi:hypothetical protein